MPTKRNILVRRNFEAYRDLTWFEQLEPKYRERGIEGRELQAIREAWNEHVDKRDWAWWQEKSAGESSSQLEDQIMDITDRLDQLGCLKWQKECAQAAQRAANDNSKETER